MSQEPRVRVGWTWWPLAVYWSSPGGFTITVRASFLVFLGSLVVMGWFLQGIVPFVQGEPIPSFIDWPALTAFVALALSGVVIHEGGHVLGYRLAGIRWTGVTAKCGASVHSDGELSDRQLLMVCSLGPVLQILFGAVLIMVAPVGSVAWLAGVLAVADGGTNLLIPISSNTDSSKIFGSLGRILKHSLQPQGQRTN